MPLQVKSMAELGNRFIQLLSRNRGRCHHWNFSLFAVSVPSASVIACPYEVFGYSNWWEAIYSLDYRSKLCAQTQGQNALRI
jgi:hypothetical protein